MTGRKSMQTQLPWSNAGAKTEKTQSTTSPTVEGNYKIRLYNNFSLNLKRFCLIQIVIKFLFMFTECRMYPPGPSGTLKALRASRGGLLLPFSTD